MFNLGMMVSRVRGLQGALPASDVETTGWSSTPLWSKLDDLDDADFVTADNGNGTQDFTVGLGAVRDPGLRTGYRIRARVRYQGLDAPTGVCNVDLFQSTNFIATLAISAASLTTSFQEFNYQLSPTEASAITDYTTLRLRVTFRPGGLGADCAGEVSGLQLELPGV